MKTRSDEMEKINPGNANGGFMLLEVLVSILLFALGIVALVGLQGRSLMVTDDVQYRAEAIHLANAYVGKMWASGLSGTNLATRFSSPGGSEYTTFLNQVTGANGIPGAQAPVVIVANNRVTPTDLTTGAAVTIPSVDVTITIRWVDREDGTIVHNYTQTSSIGYP